MQINLCIHSHLCINMVFMSVCSVIGEEGHFITDANWRWGYRSVLRKCKGVLISLTMIEIMTIKVLRWVELLILVAVATRAVPTSHPRRVPCNCAWLIDYKLTRACRLGERPTAVSSPCNSIIVVRQTDAGRAGPGRALAVPVSHAAGLLRQTVLRALWPHGRLHGREAARRNENKFPRVFSGDKFSCREADVVANNYHVMLNVRSDIATRVRRAPARPADYCLIHIKHTENFHTHRSLDLSPNLLS